MAKENGYNPEGYQEKKTGTQEKTKITSIEEGTAEELRGEGYWSKFEGSKDQLKDAKKQKCILVSCVNGASIVIALPKENTVHPKSTMGKFKKTYGKYPEDGMEVTTIMDENGFNRIMLSV